MRRGDGNHLAPRRARTTSDGEIAALIAELEEEVHGARVRSAGADAASVRRTARAVADRFARVSADRPFAARGRRGLLYDPVKLGVRKLVRWYVEPGFADQRAFNDAALRLLDDLNERVERLEAGAGGQRRADAGSDAAP
ncbi:MAG: hypothetical protein ICV64_07310 [Thermoleophilia bacterium]|nr:hypothetical protein [Thermoleophilia bacterium]